VFDSVSPDKVPRLPRCPYTWTCSLSLSLCLST
jgi:hypothetical protein